MPTMPAPMMVRSTGFSKVSLSQYPMGILLQVVIPASMQWKTAVQHRVFDTKMDASRYA